MHSALQTNSLEHLQKGNKINQWKIKKELENKSLTVYHPRQETMSGEEIKSRKKAVMWTWVQIVFSTSDSE